VVVDRGISVVELRLLVSGFGILTNHYLAKRTYFDRGHVGVVRSRILGGEHALRVIGIHSEWLGLGMREILQGRD
jgi:hypothetical protein